MLTTKTCIRVAPDGTLKGHAPDLPPGEHQVEIALLEAATAPSGPAEIERLRRSVRAIQQEIASLPVRDHRSPEEIVGYDETGSFD